jgi:uncharacterized membrane protein
MLDPTDIDVSSYYPPEEWRPVGGPEVHTDMVLLPHRSLSRKGFLWLMAAICFSCFSTGLVFALAGAWPILIFSGVDVLLVWLAFKLNYRSGRMFETVRLTDEEILVRHMSPSGRESRFTFRPPHWLSVGMDDPPRADSRLTLSSHGKQLEIGRFLPPAEKVEVARALRRALGEMKVRPAD